MKNFSDMISSFVKEVVDYAVEQGKIHGSVRSKVKKMLRKEELDIGEATDLTVETDSVDISIKPSTDSVLHFEIWGGDIEELKSVEIKHQKEGNSFIFSCSIRDLESHNLSISMFVPEKISNLSLSSENGDVTVLENSIQKLKIFTKNGDIRCKKVTVVDTAQLQSKNGDTKFSSCSTTELKMTSENGDINCKKVTANDVQLQSKNGDITIEDCNVKNPIQAVSKNGDVIQRTPCTVVSI